MFSLVLDPHKAAKNFYLHESPYGDLMLRAAQNLPPNSILFSLPYNKNNNDNNSNSNSNCIIAYDTVRTTILSRFLLDHEEEILAQHITTTIATTSTPYDCRRRRSWFTPEILMWLNMIYWCDDNSGDGDDDGTFSSSSSSRRRRKKQKSDVEDKGKNDADNDDNTMIDANDIAGRRISRHLRSLTEFPPNVSSWPDHLQKLLMGTNIYTVMDDTKKEETTTTLGTVQIISQVLSLVDQVRQWIVTEEEKNKDRRHIDPTIRQMFLPESSSIFTAKSLAWARGHFMSRRFPELKMKQPSSSAAATTPATTISGSGNQTFLNHTPGYGDKLSCFIPVIDLMNHKPDPSSTCTVALEEEEQQQRGSGSGVSNSTVVVVVRVGPNGLKKDEEVCYNYGTLSNEALLQGYGFCLQDNPFDRISFRIRKQQRQQPSKQSNTDNDNNANESDNNAEETFFVGRGGLSELSPEFWKAISSVRTTDDENGAKEDGKKDDADHHEQQLEVELDDLERLKEYVESKLKQLLQAPGWNTNSTSGDSSSKEADKEEATVMNTSTAAMSSTATATTATVTNSSGSSSSAMVLFDNVRRQFIRHYLTGQKEILEQLQNDLDEMIQQSRNSSDDGNDNG